MAAKAKQDETPAAPDPATVVDGNAAPDANLEAPPLPPTPDSVGTASTVTATPDDDGFEAVVIVGPKDGGLYPYIRVQPYDVAVGAEVAVADVTNDDRVRAIYVGGRWVRALVDTYPPVTQKGPQDS